MVFYHTDRAYAITAKLQWFLFDRKFWFRNKILFPQYLVLGQREQGEHVVVLLLDKERVFLAVEPFRQTVRDREQDPFVRAEKWGDMRDVPGRRFVQTRAGMLTTVADHTAGAFRLFPLV